MKQSLEKQMLVELNYQRIDERDFKRLYEAAFNLKASEVVALFHK